MPEPITSAVIARAASEAGSQTGDVTGRLIERMLGPAADEFGKAIARSVAFRMRNFGRIADKAAKKASADGGHGIVNARLAYTMLDEDASLCDDELMAEYMGGILAGGRTPDGRDDRGVTWTRVVTGLSVFQVRAHYLLYREWAVRLRDVRLNMGVDGEREKAGMQVEALQFATLLIGESGLDANQVVSHTIPGLANAGLLGARYAITSTAQDNEDVRFMAGDPRFDHLVYVQPSVPGLELYGWAQGLSGLSPVQFTQKAEAFDTDPPLPRLNVAFEQLDVVDAEVVDAEVVDAEVVDAELLP